MNARLELSQRGSSSKFIGGYFQTYNNDSRSMCRNIVAMRVGEEAKSQVVKKEYMVVKWSTRDERI